MQKVGITVFVYCCFLLAAISSFAEEAQFGWGTPTAVTLFSETEAFNDHCDYDCIEGTRYLHLIHPGGVQNHYFYHYLAWVTDLTPGDVVQASVWHKQEATTSCSYNGVYVRGSMDFCAVWTNGPSFHDITSSGAEVIDTISPSGWMQKNLEVITPTDATGVVLAVRTYIQCTQGGFHCLVDDLFVSFPDNSSLMLPAGTVELEVLTFDSMKALYR